MLIGKLWPYKLKSTHEQWNMTTINAYMRVTYKILPRTQEYLFHKLYR